MMTEENKQILILGAGYAGIMAAVRLAGKAKRLNASITLVNASEHFVERPRLHEKATGIELKSRPITKMLHNTGVSFIRGWATEFDPQERAVRVQQDSEERLISYDYLVLALGSRIDRWSVPGVDVHAFTLDPYGDMTTDRLKARLADLGAKSFRLIVVGGGATGIEAAAQVRGRYPRSEVSIITNGRVGDFKGENVERHIHEALAEQSISVQENVNIIEVTEEGVRSETGLQHADIMVWAGGFYASPLAREAGLKTNTRDQVKVDPFLRSLSHPEIYAVGDAAHPVEEPGAPWRMSLFTALVSGAQAADNIAAALKGKELRPLSYAWYGQAIALGPLDAVGFSTYPADGPWSLILRRMLAVRIRSFFVWYLGAALEIERRLPGIFFWNGKKRYAQAKSRTMKANPQELTN